MIRRAQWHIAPPPGPSQGSPHTTLGSQYVLGLWAMNNNGKKGDFKQINFLNKALGHWHTLTDAPHPPPNKASSNLKVLEAE